LPALALAGLQLVTTIGPVVAVLQVVVAHPSVESPTTLEQEAEGVGPVTAVPGQAVMVQLLPALAAAAVQEGAPTGPTTRTGQVVVV
jgi:hypothetical protein